MSAVFEAESVRFTYAAARTPAVADVSVAVATGTVHAVIGPNGSGKSTLLRLLLGVLRPSSGRVKFCGRDTATWSRREIARRIGVVTQLEEIPFPITVLELVTMGRYPHLGPWRSASADDRAAITRAMERCEVEHLAGRPMATLSGGERQRARLARALAQEPATFVLDEPTASLDIAHEMTIFELLGALASRDGASVVIVTHHVNLAARYADRLMLLDAGQVVAEGRPADVLTRETIELAYRWPINVFPHPGPGPDAGAPQIAALARGDNAPTPSSLDSRRESAPND